MYTPNVAKPMAPKVNPVSRQNFDVLSVLGAGGFGKVFLVRKTDGADSGRLYAMKVLEKADIMKTKKFIEYTKTERQVLEEVKCSPFLIELHYAFQTSEKLHLILDYVCGGDLFAHFCEQQEFPEKDVCFYVGEVVLALEQLHKIGVIYRDLKPENLLIDKEGHLILTDFGLSKKFMPNETPRTYSYCGTLEYMAPEVVQEAPSGHGMAADWWSTGILTCELLTGNHPFSVKGKRRYEERLRRRILTAKPRIPNSISPEASDFILKLLVKDPEERLGGGENGAEDVKRHPFFRDINWTALGQKRISAPFTPISSNKMDATQISDEPDTPSSSHRTSPLSSDSTFRGYSYVRPMPSENVFSGQPTGDSFFNSENILSFKFEESLFFENYELDLKDGILGYGSFSVCRKCTNRQTGKEFAVKIMTHKIDCTQEINLLLMCQGHPNIVHLHEVYYDEAHTYIVLELLRGGELLDRIRKKGRFTETVASQIMRQLISALNFMHSCGVVHRDLKPENILFTDDSDEADIKIVDFGFAGLKQENQRMHTPCFTLQYAAPEVLEEAFSNGTDGYDENCDLWSLGVTLYTMLCGHAPFQVQPGDDGAAVMARIKGEEFGSDIDALDHISLEAKYVTKGLLTADPKDRLKLSDLTYNGWVQGFSVIPEPTTLLLIPDSAFHVAYQEVVVDDEWAQRTWTEELSTDTCSYSTPSTHSATSSSGVPLAEVVSGSSASAISHVTEDKSHNSGLTLFVTSGGPLIQPRKRKRSEAASSFFLTYENYYDDNYINVKCKKRRYTAL